MSDPFLEYYTKYHKEHANNGYRMGNDAVRNTSRVQILKQWIKEEVPAGSKILDVGCGDMFLSTILPEYEWSGIDVATDHAPKAVKHSLTDAPYPFKDGEFDAAVCSEVLEHLFDPRVVHREVRRLVKLDGSYFVSTPNFNHMDHFFTHFKEVEFQDTASHFFEHIRWYSKDSHIKLLAQAGFQTVAYSGADAHFSKAMQPARQSLVDQKLAKDLYEADVILGKCFPDISHTIMLKTVRKV